jgi:hypothetical protein
VLVDEDSADQRAYNRANAFLATLQRELKIEPTE